MSRDGRGNSEEINEMVTEIRAVYPRQGASSSHKVHWILRIHGLILEFGYASPVNFWPVNPAEGNRQVYYDKYAPVGNYPPPSIAHGGYALLGNYPPPPVAHGGYAPLGNYPPPPSAHRGVPL